ncbi:MAG: hypothetical protein EBY17_25715 [Acidobacteriia bacterium]|nr:hypothetical protein [Terriglobia bacterium]
MDFILLALPHRIAEFFRGIGLGSTKTTGSLLHLLLQLLVVLPHALFLIGHLLGCLLVFLTLAEVLTEALFVILLLPGESLGFVREVGHFRAILLAAHGLDGLLCLLQAFGSALGFGLSGGTSLLAGLAGGSGRAHVAGSLFELADGLLQLLAAGLFLAGHGPIRRLLLLPLLIPRILLTGLLTGLARLTGLSLLTLLTLLTLLALLALLTLLASSLLLTLLALFPTLQLLHFATKLFGFATQHFLLPALLS